MAPPRTAGDGQERDPERHHAVEAQAGLPDDLEAEQLVEPAGQGEEVVARRTRAAAGRFIRVEPGGLLVAWLYALKPQTASQRTTSRRLRTT